jgi:hypothetical protein
MSRRKIRNPKRKRKIKIPRISLRSVALANLAEERKVERQEKEILVESLIIDDKLDPNEINSYKYIQKVAKDIGWSTGRLASTIQRMKLEEFIEERIEK